MFTDRGYAELNSMDPLEAEPDFYQAKEKKSPLCWPSKCLEKGALVCTSTVNIFFAKLNI